MLLDLKTMLFMVVITSVLYAITIGFFAKQANQYLGIKTYMWGAFFSALGFLSGMVYYLYPNAINVRFLSVVSFNISSYFYCLGIGVFLEVRVYKIALRYFLLFSFFSAFYLILFSKNNVLINMITAVYAIIFYSIACCYLWQRRQENFSGSVYFMLASLTFLIITLIYRCYFITIHQIQSSFTNDILNNRFLLAVFIGAYLRNVGFITMVSHRLYQDLTASALYDFLTKIYNRRATQQLIENQFLVFKRQPQACSLILIDIDYFKAVNDNYGHDVGDSVLKNVAQTLKKQLRKEDILGRWGGEEFLIFLPNTDLNAAQKMGEKLRYCVEQHFIADIHCTISLGIKVLTPSDESIEQAINHADKALYQAKHNGRNQVIIYNNPHLY